MDSQKEKLKAYYKLNKETIRAKARERRKGVRGRNVERNLWFKTHYGISLEDYNKLFKDQNGCCKICNKPQAVFTKRFAIDHCHETGKIRGLLCNQCNLGLGYFKDNIDFLKAAIKYLKL